MNSTDFNLDIFVASNIGTLKHVEFDSRPKAKRKVHQLRAVGEVEKGQGVRCMTWADPLRTSLLLARKDGVVQTYGLADGRFEDLPLRTEPLNSIVKRDDLVFGSVDAGLVKIWNLHSEAESEIETGGRLDRMKISDEEPFRVATGGNENDLKVWDVENKCATFRAKNVPHDWLQLRVPIWVSDICFLPGSDGKLVSVCSRYGVVRLYDTRAQRRPVCSVEMDGQAASRITHGKREKHVLVGTGRGLLNLVDLRKKGNLDKSYKDSVGAVTDVVYESAGDVVVASSLDRHLRIYNFESKELVYKQYLTSKLSCFLLRTGESKIKTEIDEREENVACEDGPAEVKEESDPEYEEMFEKMEVIRDGADTKTKLKNGQVEAEIKVEKKKKIKKQKAEEFVQTEERPKRRKLDADIEIDPALDESIKKLLKSTEKQKKKLEKQKKEKKAKSLFSRK